MKSLMNKLKLPRLSWKGRAAGAAGSAAAATAGLAILSKSKYDRVDIMIGAFGIGLGITCATFPWYIFFNQEKFGVREFSFSNKGTGSSFAAPETAFAPIGAPFTAAELPKMNLDFFPTATVRPERKKPAPVPLADQPYPAEKPSYELVFVANGRALIQDEDGLWVVQRGSRLPDSSKVVKIEKRGGKWVLVNSNDATIEMTH